MSDLLATWSQGYALLDSGAGKKLEMLAGKRVIRPCPQALWKTRLSDKEWHSATSICERLEGGGGAWRHLKGDPGDFTLRWQGIPESAPLTFRLRLTAFGHCGLFFETAPLWLSIQESAKNREKPLRFANLFAYTGAASLAAAAMGAEVFHVDAAKGVLDWGKESLSLSSPLPGKIQWIHDDARAFLKLGLKRGFRYDCILADPPAWGHGTQGKKWDFHQDILNLVHECAEVLNPGGRLILTSHTEGVQRQALENLFADEDMEEITGGEMGVKHAHDNRILPAGIWCEGRKA